MLNIGKGRFCGNIANSLKRNERDTKTFSSRTGRLAGCGQGKGSAPTRPAKAGRNIRHWYAWRTPYKFPQTYLLGRTDEMKRKVTLEDVLAEDEIDLILRYRELPKEKQAKLSSVAFGLGE